MECYVRYSKFCIQSITSSEQLTMTISWDAIHAIDNLTCFFSAKTARVFSQDLILLVTRQIETVLRYFKGWFWVERLRFFSAGKGILHNSPRCSMKGKISTCFFGGDANQLIYRYLVCDKSLAVLSIIDPAPVSWSPTAVVIRAVFSRNPQSVSKWVELWDISSHILCLAKF